MPNFASKHELKARYDRDGFVVVRQFLNQPQLGLLEANLDRYIYEVVPTLPTTPGWS